MVGLVFLGVFLILGVVAGFAKELSEFDDNYPDYKDKKDE
jgi:hypothetical protein